MASFSSRILCLLFSTLVAPSFSSFVRVASNGRTLELGGKPFLIRGFNYFEGIWLGMSDSDGGNRSRLHRDLAAMESLGVNCVRIMAGSLGPDGSPYRWSPALLAMPSAPVEPVFEGYDYFLQTLRTYDIKVIVSLADFWHASGGFGQYVSWASNECIPYPPSFPDWTGNWTTYITYARRFYTDLRILDFCQKMLSRHINMVVHRNNSFSGNLYSNDPTILAWELTNEPQQPPLWWINDTANFVKSLDSNHLVTTGLEGKELDNCSSFSKWHFVKSVDFATVHCWVENWGIYLPYNMSTDNLHNAIAFAQGFLSNKSQCAADSFQKPILLEEFGMARDGTKHLHWNDQSPENRFSQHAPTTHRDTFFEHVCNRALSLVSEGGYLTGLMPWAWSGQGRPLDPGPRRLGDPPHETPGWYSIFDSDASTLEVLSQCFTRLTEAEAGGVMQGRTSNDGNV